MAPRKKIPEAFCLVCNRQFQPTRTWQRFCSSSCRSDARAGEHGAEYTCAYCGLFADTVDRIPPTSVRQTLIDMGIAQRYPFLEVRACRECNSSLNDRPLWTVAQRKRYLLKFLKRRYRKYLRIPDWDDTELAQLSDTLQMSVLHSLAVRDLTLQRISRLK